MDRRLFLKSAVLGGSISGLSVMGLLANQNAQAQAAADYKALVCVYLFGGNDGHNSIVPYETSAYSQYAALRPEFNGSNLTGLGVPRNGLLPLSADRNSSALLGLHPSLSRTHARWGLGQVAWVQNVGNLVEPLTRTNFTVKAKPAALLSHLEQQEISMLALQDPAGLGSNEGWSARLLQLALQRGVFSSTDLSLISFAGQNRLQATQRWVPEVLVPNRLFQLDNQSQIGPILMQGLTSSRPFTQAYSRQVAKAYALGNQVNTVFGNSNTPAQQAFISAVDGASSYLGTQLMSVVRFIEARSQLQAPGRQVFFVAVGGYDTHGEQYTAHSNLLGDLDRSLYGFFSAIEALGLGQQVTAFTMSDFGRTLRANASHGTDHAWASHLMVMGGAVRGGLYGRAADITPTSPDIHPEDSNIVIPSTSINQYAATLAAWMGLNPTDLNAVFPDLRNFTQANLGFLNS